VAVTARAGSGRPSSRPCAADTPNNTPQLPNYSRKLCRFSEPDPKDLAIDEKGSLPYKPRQPSAMIPVTPGRLVLAGKWPARASQHWRTYLHLPGRLPALSGQKCQRENDREADLSTQQTGAQAPSWFPRAHCHDRRPEGPCRTSRPWPQASERLSPKTGLFRRIPSWIG